MCSVVRLLRSVLILSLLAGLIAPLTPVVSAQEPGTPEPSEEFQALEAGTGSLEVLGFDDSGNPLNDVCFIIDDGDNGGGHHLCTGYGGVPGQSWVAELPAGEHTIYFYAPPDYQPAVSETQSFTITAGETTTVSYTFTLMPPTPENPPDYPLMTLSQAVVVSTTPPWEGVVEVTVGMEVFFVFQISDFSVGLTGVRVETDRFGTICEGITIAPMEWYACERPYTITEDDLAAGLLSVITSVTADGLDPIIETLNWPIVEASESDPDTTGPNVAFDIIEDGDTFTGVVSIAANADDPAGVAAVRFKYSLTPTVSESWVMIAEDTDGSDGWWTDLDTTPLPNGPVSLRAVAEDVLGNTSTVEISVLIDNPDPDTIPLTAYFLSPQPGATLTGTVTISAYADDPSGVAAVRFEYSTTPSESAGWVLIANDTDGTDGWSAELDTTAIPDGPVTVRLYADNIPGNSSRSTSINVIIANLMSTPTPTEIVDPDTTPPTAYFISPQTGDTLAGTVTISAHAEDASGVAFVRFEYNLTPSDLTSWVLIANDTDGTDGWSGDLDTTAIPDGPVTIRLYADDIPGSSRSTSINVTIANPVAAPELQVALTASDDVAAGATVDFDITITNAGDAPAHDVMLVDDLPFGMVWSIDAGVPGCEIAGSTLGCELGTLAADDSVTIRVTGATSTNQCGVLENTATVSASNALAAADSASVTINCSDLVLVVAPSMGVINAGDIANFTITVTNYGPGTALDVIVNDVLPPGYWTIDSDVAVCAGNVAMLECALDILAPNASLTIMVSRPTGVADCGVIMNTATVAASNEPIYQISNNQSMGSISINCPSGIQVTLLDENNDPLPGGCFDLWETVDGTQFGAYVGTACDDYDGAPDGVTRFTDVPSGSYIVRQSDSPSMYPRMGQQVVTVAEGEPALVTFTAPLGGKVTAMFLFGTQPATEFHVGIYTDNGSGGEGDFVKNGVEGRGSDPADGTITIDNLPVGNYVLRGFHFDAYLSPAPVPFSIVAGEETAFDVPVDLGGSIRLITTDAESDATILGACFRFYPEEARTTIVGDTCDIGDGVDDGVNVLGKLTTGTYYWEQLIAAPNYIAGQTGTAEVTLGQETIVPVENILAGSIVVTLLDEQGEPLVGGYFSLKNAEGVEIALSCDSCDGYPDGESTFNGIPAGDYIVVQWVAIDGYLPAPNEPVTVTTGQATPVEMIASVAPPPSGEPPVANQDDVITTVGQAVTISVLANDTDADTPVGELTVALLPADGPAHGTVALDATDSNAIVYIPNPGFFGVDSFYYEVSDGSNVATGAVRITVVGDLVLNVTSFDATGALAPWRCFELWSLLPDDSPERQLTVECDYNGDGMTTFTGLGTGRVLLRGYDAPDGMEPIADLLVSVGPDPVTEISISYELAQGTGALVINATNGADPLNGACWRLTNDLESPQSGHFGCDTYDVVDGQTRIYGIEPGDYTLRQRITPAGHVTAADQSVEIVAGQVLTLNVPHAEGDALRINTVHEDGSTISGICVTVATLSGETLTSTCDTVYGDGVQDGTIVLPVLPPGDYTATIFGNPSPDDYLPIRSYPFSVDTNGTVDTGDGDNTVFVTYQRGGTVLIHIVDESGQPLSDFTCLSLYHANGDGSRGANIYGSGNSACAYQMNGPDDTLIIDDVRVFGLAPGNYVIGIGSPSNGYTMTDTPLTVTAGIVNEITVTLSEQAGDAASLDAAPLDQNYAPITNARFGQTIQIAYAVINTGSTPLTGLSVEGDLFGVLFTLDTLEPDYPGMQGFNQPYVITAADAMRGSVSFTTTLTTNELAPIVSIVTVPVTAAPNTEEPGEPVEAAGGTGATLTFTGIEQAGFTAVTRLLEPPAEELPGGFSVEGALFFEISTTATFNGDVLVCIPYETGSIPNARLLHFDDGAWVDITSVEDSSDGLVCGITDHFSPFAIAELLDGAGPVITTPDAITAEATSASGATITFQEVTAVDSGSGLAMLTCSHTSGDTFALGTTTVSCTAADYAGNTSSESFTITVQDTTGPAFAGAAPITAEATSPSGAAVTFVVPTATDLVSGTVIVTCDRTSGATFLIGATTVTCTAEDGTGNAGTASFTIKVQTTLAPTNKNQCKNSGWKRFNNPFFVDQGSCVAYLEKKK